MAHLLLHDTGSEVPCVKIVDGVFVISVDEHEEGDELSCSHGDYSDAETFARFGVSAFYSAEKNARNKIKVCVSERNLFREKLRSMWIRGKYRIHGRGCDGRVDVRLETRLGE